MRKGRETWKSSAWRRGDWGGILPILINISWAGAKWIDPGYFQWCPVTQQGATGTQTGMQEFPSEHEENFLYFRVTEYWNRLPREAVEISSLEILSNHLDTFLCNLS